MAGCGLPNGDSSLAKEGGKSLAKRSAILVADFTKVHTDPAFKHHFPAVANYLIPPFAKCAKDGTPTVWLMSAKTKSPATRRKVSTGIGESNSRQFRLAPNYSVCEA